MEIALSTNSNFTTSRHLHAICLHLKTQLSHRHKIMFVASIALLDKLSFSSRRTSHKGINIKCEFNLQYVGIFMQFACILNFN